MKGVDRAALYLIAATTGYRRKELRSLTLHNFDLDAETPTISVSARATKAGHSDCQPIPKVVAEYLKDWIGSKTQNGPLFSKMPVNTARTLRWDLKAAEIPYCDDSGRVFDFHALRGAYISRIERSGATPKTLLTLARHSDPRLTMKRYARIRLNDQVAAVEQLSTLVPNQTSCRAPLEATGTCDHSAQQYTQQRGRETVQNSATRCDDSGHRPSPGQTPKRLVLSVKSDEMRRGATRNEKRPRRDLNPCFQDENLMSQVINSKSKESYDSGKLDDSSRHSSRNQKITEITPQLGIIHQALAMLPGVERDAVAQHINALATMSKKQRHAILTLTEEET